MPLLLLFVVLLSLPCGILVTRDGVISFSRLLQLVGSLMAVFPATVFLLCSRYRLAKYLISASLWILVIIEVWLILTVKSRITTAMVILLMQTDTGEAASFLGMNLLSPASAVALLVIAVISTVYYVSRRFYSKSALKQLLQNHKRTVLCVILAVNVLSLSVLAVYRYTNLLIVRFSCPTTIDNLAASFGPVKSSSELITTAIKALDDVDGQLTGEDTPGLIIIIIGESFNPNHASCYGYRLKTTPMLDREVEAGNLLVFEDVVSPSAKTFEVIVNSFAVDGVNDVAVQMEKPLFTSLFKHAGYRVTLHDNQTLKHSGDLGSGVPCSFFFNSSEIEAANLSYRNSTMTNYDADFVACQLDTLRSLIATHSAPTLAVFHLRGQHLPATQYCPNDFVRFSGGSDYGFRTDLNVDQKRIVAGYDNATAYNDSVMSIIHKAAVDFGDAVVIYMSDHGENVYDIGNSYGRIFGYVDRAVADNMYRVPFTVFTTETFRENHPRLYRRLTEAQKRPILSSDISQMLMGLGGVSTRFYVGARDPLQSDYNSKGRRVVNNMADYDTLKL